MPRALYQQQQSHEHEHAVALGNQCLRAQLAVLAKCDVLGKQGSIYQLRPLHGYGYPQLMTLEEPIRRQQPTLKSQPRPVVIWMTGGPDCWQNCTDFPLGQFICKLRGYVLFEVPIGCSRLIRLH